MNRLKQTSLLVATLLCAAVAWSGCGGDDEGSDGGSGGLLGGEQDTSGGGATSTGTSQTTGDTGGSTTTTTPDCDYPDNSGLIALGKVMPRLWWEDAELPDGTGGTFDLQSFHCDPAYEDYSVVVFVVSAGWCPACPDYIRHVGGQADQLEAAGALLVFVETELADGTPATGPDADAHITELLGVEDKGIRLGDGSTQPEARTIYQAPLIAGFPAGFVVRRSDMVIIADQSESQYYLPFEEIAQNPDHVRPPFDPNREPSCDPAEEEIYEPNDTPAQATVLTEGDYRGGICNGSPDFYTISPSRPDGRWLFEIRFSQKDGDLDFYLWDPETDRAVVDGQGNPIGSDSSDDNEVFQWQGPATIKIFGYNGSTAAYEFSLGDL